MNAIDHTEVSLGETERRLQRVLAAEADRLADLEPPRLAAACRAPRQPPPVRGRRPLWPWAVAASAVLLLAVSAGYTLLRAPEEKKPRRFAVVTPEIDRAALFAALPHIPAPSRPPPPRRMTSDVVIHVPPS